jgi:transglutaminase-like putative cysteine protease
MMLAIRHETIYRYTAPMSYTIQQLRLTPRSEAHQRIRDWRVTAPGSCHSYLDAYGNQSHILTVNGMHDEIRIVAAGRLDVDELDRGRLDGLDGKDRLSPLVYTVTTRLTEADAGLADFARRNLDGTDSRAAMALAEAITGAVSYLTGATEVTTTAQDALKLGKGVCQDHAHLFLACCHVQGIPARYVSGYIDPGNSDHAESHAWVDVWVEDSDFTGWASIDVTHANFQNAQYCRLAIGRDYDSAAPVRGLRRGGGVESMEVHVSVERR